MRITFRTLIAFLCLSSTAFSADYFPLTVGNTWKYATVAEGISISYIMKVSRKLQNGADSVFCVSNEIDFVIDKESFDAYLMSSGNDIFAFDSLTDSKPYDKVFEHQPTAGHEWTYSTGGKRKIVYYGSITVPAGTFNSCYAIVENGDTTEIYAPDVGMVVMAAEDGIAVKLSSYTIVPSSPVRYFPQPTSFTNTISATGIHSCVDLQGRYAKSTLAGRNGMQSSTLSPGTFLFFDKRTLGADVNGMTKRCVIGR